MPWPTETPTPTQQPLPTLVTPAAGASEYKLARPDPERMLQILAESNRQSQDSSVYVSREDDGHLRADADGVGRTIAIELRRLFPEGIPNARSVLEVDWDASSGLVPIPDLELIGDGVADWINQQGLELKEGQALDHHAFSAMVRVVELDRDSTPEWLIWISSEKFGTTAWLALDQVTPGQYARLPDAPPATRFLPNHDYQDLVSVRDWTGDGLSDFVFSTETYTWGRLTGSLSFYQGTSRGFVFAGEPLTHQRVADGEEYDYTVTVPAGATTPMLTLVESHWWNWDCTWDTITTIQWVEGVRQDRTTGAEAPETPECRLAAVSKPPSTETVPNRIGAYEAILEDLPETPARMPHRLFIHFQLALLSLQIGDTQSAQSHLTWIGQYNEAAGSEVERFVPDVISRELQRTAPDLIQLCADVSKIARKQQPGLEVMQSYLTLSLIFQAYPYYSEPWPPILCPLEDVLTGAIAELELKPETVEAQLTAAGLDVIEVMPIGLIDARLQAVVVDVDQPWLALIDAEGRVRSTWSALGDPEGELTVVNTDLDGDGTLDGVLAQPIVPDRDMFACSDGTRMYTLTMLFGRSATIATTHECLPAVDPLADLDLRQRLASGGAPPTPEPTNATASWWLTLPDLDRSQPFPATDATLYVLTSINEQVLADPASAQSRRLLEQALALLPADRIEADRVRQHLTYLLALSHELTGEETRAVALYYEVWTSPRPTLWGHLAALRLTPNDNHDGGQP